jgi:hypothetical protein
MKFINKMQLLIKIMIKYNKVKNKIKIHHNFKKDTNSCKKKNKE